MKKPSYLWRHFIWNALSLMFLFLIALSLVYFYLDSQLPSVSSLNVIRLQIPLRIYTKDGKLIQEYGEKRRLPVSMKEIPKPLIQAILATEDQRFFEHSGVDFLGLSRAAVRMIQTGTKSQGGSTITMQVARNFFLSRKKTFLRKFKEILLAIKIDRELPKEKILELYLNKIYLGNRAYGVGAAAQIYYGKTLKELTLAEMAMIAGLPQAPSTQNPITNPTAAQKRRDHVLDRMLEGKYISQTDYEQAIKEPLNAQYHGAKIEVTAPYVAEMIRQSLYQYFGKSAYTKGYKVYTTIDSTLQLAANAATLNQLLAYDHRHGYRGPRAHVDLKAKDDFSFLNTYAEIDTLIPGVVTQVERREITVHAKGDKVITIPFKGFQWARKALRRGWYGPEIYEASQVAKVGDIVYAREVENQWFIEQIPEVEAALVAIDPSQGSIKALIGGLDFASSKFNRATQAGRQSGSSFKPFIYAAALEKGYTLATLINDAPIVVYDPSQPHSLYRPHNHNRAFSGPTRLKEGLTKSKNLVSLRILDDIGIDYAVDFVQRFGFPKANLPHALSLALGSTSTSPLDMSVAYAVFANGGYRIQPYLIEEVTTHAGKILLKAKPTQAGHAPRVLNEDVAFLMQDALRGVIQEGTGTAALSLKRDDIAGKTGTTNDQVDAWFAGFHPHLVTTVWVGYDNPRSLHEYGANAALPLWIDFMKVALPALPYRPFTPPASVVAYPISKKTGLLVNANQYGSMMEFFQKTNPPEATDVTQVETENAAPTAQVKATTEETNLF